MYRFENRNNASSIPGRSTPPRQHLKSCYFCCKLERYPGDRLWKVAVPWTNCRQSIIISWCRRTASDLEQWMGTAFGRVKAEKREWQTATELIPWTAVAMPVCISDSWLPIQFATGTRNICLQSLGTCCFFFLHLLFWHFQLPWCVPLHSPTPIIWVFAMFWALTQSIGLFVCWLGTWQG